MDRTDLKKIMQNNRVPSDLYSLNGGFPSESYCLNEVNNNWEVYYSERGVKSGIVNFDNESEACEYFLKEIGKIVNIADIKN